MNPGVLSRGAVLCLRGVRILALWFGFVLSMSMAQGASATGLPPRPAPSPSFTREVRPILAEQCYTCHGPDAATRKAGLRLDLRESALGRAKSGAIPVVPGKPAESELIRRIFSEDPEEIMPPPKASGSAHGLPPAAKATLKAWVAAGAPYEGHWAFSPPQRPPLPTPRQADWTRSPVDLFVLEKLEQVGLSPNRAADRRTQLRRLALDLTGLPPSLEELRAFEADTRPDAYERRVDQWLASPAFGEHLAAQWLDLARYADSSGFQGDPYRSMWRWRDYVLESFNTNKPFNRFTLEQIAGDLLPGASTETQLATGFNRNHRFNTEFGSIEEEWKVEYVVDRIETTGATWLALTLGCGRCHDHKFDPITQKDFYGLFAMLGNIPERGVYWDGSEPAFPPSMRAPTPAQERTRDRLRGAIADAHAARAALEPTLRHELRTWLQTHRARLPDQVPAWLAASHPADLGDQPQGLLPRLPSGLVVHLPLQTNTHATFGTRVLTGTNETRSPRVTPAGQPFTETNRVPWTNTIHFAGQVHIQPLDPARFRPANQGGGLELNPGAPPLTLTHVLDRSQFSLTLEVLPRNGNGVLFSKMGRSALHPLGVELLLTNQHLRLVINHEPYDFDATMVPLELVDPEPLPPGRWHHLAVTVDGRRTQRGPVLYVNGMPRALEPKQATARALTSITNSVPLQVGTGSGEPPMEGTIRDFRIYDRTLAPGEVLLLARRHEALALTKPAPNRQEKAIAARFFRDFVSTEWETASARVHAAEAALKQFEESLPLVMVMKERPTPPTAHLLHRGQYDAPRERIDAAVPAAFGPLPKGAPSNRLGLAEWLVAPENPLTARVLVNRLWERFLGAGLVRTTEDFGVQSEPPTHPELLDWMATELARNAWDLKQMIRIIVTSATYRQDSAPTAEAARKDPENRWLSRAARFRLPAEVLRDQALSVAGLLQPQLGGPSVTPYTPGNTPAHAPQLYRRSLYSHWQRTRFNPAMAVFDAPAREACTVRRPRTNTPLQALALLNETTFIEAARHLGLRMMSAGLPDADAIAAGFERVTGRAPNPKEQTLLVRLLEGQLQRYRSDPAAAELLTRVGASPKPHGVDTVRLAAFTLVANALLNLDETVTRP